MTDTNLRLRVLAEKWRAEFAELPEPGEFGHDSTTDMVEYEVAQARAECADEVLKRLDTIEKPVIELLEITPTDGTAETLMFVNGVQHSADVLISIDPGRGYDRETWDEHVQGSLAGCRTDAFREAVREQFGYASDSKYIQDSW